MFAEKLTWERTALGLDAIIAAQANKTTIMRCFIDNLSFVIKWHRKADCVQGDNFQPANSPPANHCYYSLTIRWFRKVRTVAKVPTRKTASFNL
jgi:hypothetical protein